MDAHLIQTVLLRSLRQAVYAPDNLGHFGLAYEAYAHFTSPIRRYPDLLVHRAIRHILSKKKSRDFYISDEEMLLLGEHCSMTERRADEATRDAVDWLKCEYMLDKLGQQYDGIITSVTNFGIFIELQDFYVEGLVHVTALKHDYYHFDAVHHRLIGERSNKMYRLGDPVRVTIARVDLDERKIDFELADDQPQLESDRTDTRRVKSRRGKRKQKGGKSGDTTSKDKRAKKKQSKKTTKSSGSSSTSQKKTSKKRTSITKKKKARRKR